MAIIPYGANMVPATAGAMVAANAINRLVDAVAEYAPDVGRFFVRRYENYNNPADGGFSQWAQRHRALRNAVNSTNSTFHPPSGGGGGYSSFSGGGYSRSSMRIRRRRRPFRRGRRFLRRRYGVTRYRRYRRY